VRLTPRSVMGIVATTAVVGLGAAVTTVANAAPAPPAKLTLTSTALADKGKIDNKYTCQGDGKPGNDVSLPLTWTAGAEKAQSYAVVFVDSFGTKPKLHWTIFDIAPTTTALKEGLAAGYDVPDVAGAHQLSMGSGKAAFQFFGPCPGGKSHPYVFTLYALKVAKLPKVTAKSKIDEIVKAIQANSLATATLNGTSNAKAG
jgi:Raf kinase inhibitor-like YbhB/YbcL family protein